MTRRLRSCLTLVAATVVLLGGGEEGRASEAPRRIVSLNLCSDQILLDLVPRDRIAGLSFLAADPAMSANVEGARGLTAIRGDAEEVLALDPDLVLAGAYSTPATVDLLKRLGRRVVVVPIASSFKEIGEAIRIMAEATGEETKGEAMIRAFEERIASVRSAHVLPRPAALSLQVNSLTAGPGSLLDEVIEAAGFTNAARTAELGPAGRLPLESVLLDPPAVLVLANSAIDYRTVLGDNLRHPALVRLLAERPSVHIPMPLWLCGTPAIAGAVELLAGAREHPAVSRAVPQTVAAGSAQ